MTEKLNPGGLPATRKKYPPAFRTERVRQVAAGTRQSDVAHDQGISPALLGRSGNARPWKQPHPTARNATASGSGARKLKRGILKKVATVGRLQPQYLNRLG